jgi:integrase
MAVTMLKDGRWIVYYRRRGNDGKSRVIKEYFGRGFDAEGKAKARDSELQLKPRRPRRLDPGPTFAKLAHAYATVHQFASPRAYDQHKIRMVSRVLPFFGPLPSSRISDDDMDRYIFSRRKAGVTFATIRRELVDVKAILNFSVRRRPPLIPFNPVRDYRIPKEDLDTIMPPTTDELAAILAAAPDHLRRIILLVYYLGLRPGPVECYRLRWENVDWCGGTLLVTGAKKGGPVKRSVPIHPDFMANLRSWWETDKARGIPWIVSWCGKTINKVCTVWEHTLTKAKITRRLRPYDLRHLFVTLALENGGDHKALSEIVGSKPETLMRHYQHVTSALRRRTVELIPPAPNIPSIPKKLD